MIICFAVVAVGSFLVIIFVNSFVKYIYCIWKIVDTTKIGSGKVTDLVGVIIIKID